MKANTNNLMIRNLIALSVYILSKKDYFENCAVINTHNNSSFIVPLISSGLNNLSSLQIRKIVVVVTDLNSIVWKLHFYLFIYYLVAVIIHPKNDTCNFKLLQTIYRMNINKNKI